MTHATASSVSLGVTMTRSDWLKQLKVGDAVDVCMGVHKRTRREVTSIDPLITVGQRRSRLNFRRHDGRLADKRPMAKYYKIERPL